MAASSALRMLNAGWLRPLFFLVFLVVLWDGAIRVFHIPPYQIPAPADVVLVLWHDWPELMGQAWPTTYATVCGFLLSALAGAARERGITKFRAEVLRGNEPMKTLLRDVIDESLQPVSAEGGVVVYEVPLADVAGPEIVSGLPSGSSR